VKHREIVLQKFEIVYTLSTWQIHDQANSLEFGLYNGISRTAQDHRPIWQAVSRARNEIVRSRRDRP